MGKHSAEEQSAPAADAQESKDEATQPVEDTPGFPSGFEGYPPVVDGVREVTQDPNFDPSTDNEEDFA